MTSIAIRRVALLTVYLSAASMAVVLGSTFYFMVVAA